jgi:Leucine-rich repeat (LRR) protein
MKINAAIELIPDWISKLRSLAILDINCDMLTALPENIGNL